MRDSRISLPKALAKLPKCSFRDQMISLAQRGAFHDFKSQYDAPKHELASLLEAGAQKTGDHRYAKLAQDARDGRFDDDL